MAKRSGDSSTLSAESLSWGNRGSLSSTLADRAFCAFTHVRERSPVTSSSHWYLSTCSTEAGDTAAVAVERHPVFPAVIPRTPMMAKLIEAKRALEQTIGYYLRGSFHQARRANADGIAKISRKIGV